jgi:glycerol-3-phosphate cytidylyltransferase
MHKKKVITYGTFDLFHIGHVRLLKRLAELGDHLTVFVSTDEFNLEKGKSSVVAYEDRAEIVRACRYVDCVLPEKRWDQKYDDIIREGISVFGMGDDWTGKFDELEGICEVVFLDRTENVSSTTLKSFIKSLGREELLEALPVIDEKLVPNFDSEKTMLSQVKSVVSLGNISNKDYHRLFAELEENHDDRSLEWLQAWILLHCAAQKKPYPTQKFISKLGRISRRRGQTDSYHTFLSYVVDEMSFLLPNGGKYTQSFRSVDIDEIIQK